MGVNRRHLEQPFPVRQFLRQLFFSPLSTVVWHPMRFWSVYRIQFLKQCWDIGSTRQTDYILLLERCWLMDLASKKDENPLQDTQEN
jgi:hypothetical protein